MNIITSYMLLFVAIFLGVIGQLLLKYGMNRQPDFQLTDVMALSRNLPVIGGFASYGISVLLYFKVLATLDLSLAYPTVSLGYVLVIIFSSIFFKEPVSLARWGAVGVICLGVAIVGFGSV